MLCVGETQQDRLSGTSDTVVLDMLSSSLPDHVDPMRLAIAYEPVWAIGTGQNADETDISAMHNQIAAVSISIRYARCACSLWRISKT